MFGLFMCALSCPEIALQKSKQMREVQRKNYSEEFREKVLAAYYDGEETVLMIARRFGIKRATVASWVRRHDQAKDQSKKVILRCQKASE
jgi:transposase-like protein